MSPTVRAWTLVAIQGVLFLVVAATALAPGPSGWVSLPLGLVLIVVGAAGVGWSGRNLGGALTPSPIPNEYGLAARGLYRWVRHPMYSSLLVICLGVAVGSGKLLCYLSVVILAAFFEVKTRMEERYLVTAYDGYAEYAAHTGKFLPGLGRRRTSR